MDPEAQETTMFHNFYADYYTMAGIAVASCMALCPAVGLMGRRGGLLMFMIITALASLLQLGLLNCEYFMRDPSPLVHETLLLKDDDNGFEYLWQCSILKTRYN